MKYPIKTFSEIFCNTISGKRVEPVKRIKDMDHVPRGFRNKHVSPRWVTHTYPIKDGKSLSETAISENITMNNSLLNLFKN